jgi:serine phosphatase RsbU (regulator of sigma subunit)/PAS domain-containing protein
LAPRQRADSGKQAPDSDGLRDRVLALRQAAAVPHADARSLLDAAMAELDAAVDAIELAPAPGSASEGASADRKLLAAIFAQVPVAIFLLGMDGTIRRANAAASALIGASPGYATGRAFSSLAEPAARAALASQLAAVGRTGEPQTRSCGLIGSRGVRPCQLTFMTVTVRGDEDRLLVVAVPLAAKDQVTGPRQAVPAPPQEPVETIDQVTDLVSALTRRLDAATAISRLLLENAAASEAQTLQRFGRLLAGTIATWVIIDVLEEGALRRHSAAGPDKEGSAGLVQAIMSAEPPAGGVASLVAASGSALLITHPEDDGILGASESGVPVLLLLGGACVLCVPIAAPGIRLGTLTLVREAAAGMFRLADVGLAEEAAEQLARTIAVQRTMRRRSEVAEALRGSLLPREPRPIPGVDVAAAHLPPTLGDDVGGDFYDIYPTPDGWGIAIGDVVGKGQDTAAVTAAARHAIRVLSHWTADPADVLFRANEIMLAEGFGSRFVTAAAAHLSWRDGRLRVVLASAGHPGPVLVLGDGRARLIEGGGVPLGIFAEGETEVTELHLCPGDLLFFCTDGLSGARSPLAGYFGDQLTDALSGLSGRSAAEVIGGLRQMLTGFCEGVLLDDVTMLALRASEAPQAAGGG